MNKNPAIARWVVQDPVVHHNFSPYSAFDNNPVYWADPSGADSTDTQRDVLGREKYDEWNNYIPVGDREDDGLGMDSDRSDSSRGLGGDNSNNGDGGDGDPKKKNNKSAKTIELEKMAVGLNLTDAVLAFFIVEATLAYAGMSSFFVYSTEANMIREGIVIKSSVSKVLGKSYKAIGEVTVPIKNTELLNSLNATSKGNWVKVYQAGLQNGVKTETHFFRNNTTNQVFDVKIKYNYWHQKAFKTLKQ